MNTKQIRNVDISGIQHLPMIDFIGNDFAIFDDIRDIPFTPYPTRLNAACLAVCRKGRCRMNINLQEYEMREGMLCIILPEQIVQQGERSDDFSGSFIAVSRDFMDVVIPTMQQLFPMKSMIFIRGTQRRNVPRKAVRRICLSTSSGMYPRAIKKSGVWPIMPARCFSRPSTFLP